MSDLSGWEVTFKADDWAELTATDGTVVRMHYSHKGRGFDSITVGAGGTGWISGRVWRRIPFTALERHFAGGLKSGDCPSLSRPDGPMTDAFLAQVAQAYRSFLSTGQPPAPGMAAQAGVPVRTIHRWIYATRKRGFLPAARQGRAG